MKAGKAESVIIDPRHAQLTAQHAIRDVYDALVELITNADGSHFRLWKASKIPQPGGSLSIEVEARRGGRSSRVIVRDRAEGLDLADMRNKIQKLGTWTTIVGDRGFMGRGLKDCAVLGRVIIDSIKEDRHCKCEINSKFQFIPYEPPGRATAEVRDRLGIPKHNGTVVTIEICEGYRVPRFENLLANLPRHYALRDIFAEGGPNKIVLRNLNEKGHRPQRVSFAAPAGELVAREGYHIDGYPAEATATLQMFRSAVALEDTSDRFRLSGFVVKGERAIHECAYFTPELERDPLGHHYFGRLECPYIDVLCQEYDERRASGAAHPESNPSLVIDPHRQSGLTRNHPFTQALFKLPVQRLRELIAREREAQAKRVQEIASKETTTRLDRLAKAAGRFLQQQLEETVELGVGEPTPNGAITEQALVIWPDYVRLILGQVRRVTIYARRDALGESSGPIRVFSEQASVVVLDPQVELRPHKDRAGTCIGSFRVRGECLEQAAQLRAVCEGYATAEAYVEVVEEVISDHTFQTPLEFEHREYQLRAGKTRTLRLFAKCPELVREPTVVDLWSSDPSSVGVQSRSTLTPAAGSNFACGDVTVQGKRIGARVTVGAKLGNYIASATVAVAQHDEPPRIGIQFKLADKDFHNYRAKWGDDDGTNQNVLYISALHKSVRRYLGPGFAGQEQPHFRVLLAEIVAESVCRKALTLHARERPGDFRWADLGNDEEIAENVIARLQQRLRAFVAEAHEIMLSDADLPATPSQAAAAGAGR